VQLNFKFSSTSDHYPHELLPALNFMRGAVSPNKARVLVGEEGVPLGEPIDLPDTVLIEDGFVRLVEDLAMVQRRTGTFFPMVTEFSEKDLGELAEAVELLEGKESTRGWSEASFELIVADPETFLQELVSKADRGAFFIDGQAAVSIGGHVVPLGKTRTFIPEARISNLADIEQAAAAAASGGDLIVPVKLEALGAKTLKRSLVS
jgi:hypothetical protein